MTVFCRPLHELRRRRVDNGGGFTLIEIMVSLAILALVTMGGVSAFMILNRYAANLRNLSEARALCQERIEQAETLSFRPTASVVPAAPSSDPTNTAACTILGPATSYNTSTGAWNGGANFQSSSESIPIYTQSDGTSAKNSANVTYARTTTVSPTTLTYAATSTSLYIVQFTVVVSYVFHGQTYSMSMTTLRGPD